MRITTTMLADQHPSAGHRQHDGAQIASQDGTKRQFPRDRGERTHLLENRSLRKQRRNSIAMKPNAAADHKTVPAKSRSRSVPG